MNQTILLDVAKRARGAHRSEAASAAKVAIGLAMVFVLGCGKTSQLPDAGDAGATGGAVGAGGAVGSGGTVGTAGASGQSGLGGAGGQAPACGSTPNCVADARRCGVDGIPEVCVSRASGCRVWEATAACSAHKGCVEGTCACVNDEHCGVPAAEGDFCPTQGGSVFGHCAADADGCLFVSGASNACAQGKTCQVAGNVATGTACGCPTNGAALGTGCSDHALTDLTSDATNGVILGCAQMGACQMWKVISDCGSQGLAAGLLSAKPACVCAEPAGQFLYVDPSPGAPSQPVGPPTGAKSPAACRLPSVTSALAKAAQKKTITWIVATHATTPIHLGMATGETFPLVIPAGMTVTSGDGGTLDPSLFILDVKTLAAPGAAVVLGDGATLSGFTVDAGGAAGAVNAGTNVSKVVACAEASKVQSANLDHVLVRAQSGMTGVAINGSCALVATSCGVSGATIGVDVARTSMGATDMASLTATDLAIASTATSSIGVRVGTGVESGVRSSVMVTGGIVGTSGSAIVVAGGIAQLTNGAISFSGPSVGSQNRGLVVSGGKATLDGSGITMGDVTGTNAIGAEITGGTAILRGVAVVGVRHMTGVQISGAADVTLSGTASSKARIATSMPAATDPSEGVVVLTGANTASVKLHGSVEINGFNNGLVLNDGALTMEPGDAGEVVTVLNNRNDGVQILGRTATPAVSLKGSTFRDNVGKGVVVRTIAPVSIQGCTVSGNDGDGIDLQRTQITTQTNMHLAAVSGSTVSGNTGRGIALTGKGVGTGVLSGGKVGAALTGNMVSLNGGVGIFVSEASDAADGDDLTEAWIEGNEVEGNMTTTAAAPGVIAGGVFFGSADATTRIQLRSFFGNRIHGNGYAEVGFNLVQNDTLPWNLSSHFADAASVCGDASTPNYIYCYGTFSGDYGIAVSGTSIHLLAKGIHFQNAPAIAGRDLSPGIPDAEVSSVCAPQACQ